MSLLILFGLCEAIRILHLWHTNNEIKKKNDVASSTAFISRNFDFWSIKSYCFFDFKQMDQVVNWLFPWARISSSSHTRVIANADLKNSKYLKFYCHFLPTHIWNVRKTHVHRMNEFNYLIKSVDFIKMFEWKPIPMNLTETELHLNTRWCVV